MNILREVRRASERSVSTRIILMSLFFVIFVVNTYAWFTAGTNFKLKGLEANVTSWDVAYHINDEPLDETVTLTIDELYPGMPKREDVINIYNKGQASTKIKYELISVKVFGQEVLEQLKANGEIQTSGNTTNIFSKETQYPFNISYTYSRDQLNGEYKDNTSTPGATGTFKFNANWDYEKNSTETENYAKDLLDTKFGKDAYAYYQDEANDPSKAIEIKVRITSEIVRQ